MEQSTSDRPPLTLWTNILYGVGSIAFGVHLAVLTSALLLFYNQVVGLPAAWVGGAMALTLIFDAICDPLIGEWSDHTRSRWGRRHPFMYASALPTAVAFYFLFDPPIGWTPGHLLIYMAVMLMTVRVLLSLYEIPSSALGPELTLDYDQRTSLMGSRFFFGTLGGAAISVLALQVFLRKDATHPLGLLNRAGYQQTAVVASIVIFLSIIISCVGTQRFIGSLVQAPRVRGTWREKLAEVGGTVTNRSFLALTISGIVGAVSAGLRQGLDFYISAYFFELTPAQMSYLAAAALFAAFAGVALAPAVSRRFGKKQSMIGVFFASLFASVAPIAMRLIGTPAAQRHRRIVRDRVRLQFLRRDPRPLRIHHRKLDDGGRGRRRGGLDRTTIGRPAVRRQRPHLQMRHGSWHLLFRTHARVGQLSAACDPRPG